MFYNLSDEFTMYKGAIKNDTQNCFQRQALNVLSINTQFHVNRYEHTMETYKMLDHSSFAIETRAMKSPFKMFFTECRQRRLTWMLKDMH